MKFWRKSDEIWRIIGGKLERLPKMFKNLSVCYFYVPVCKNFNNFEKIREDSWEILVKF